MVTKTAVIILCEKAVLIWAIPPLLPQPPDFFDHNPTHMPPLFTILLPVISRHPQSKDWNTISSWYFGSSQPLYFNFVCQDSKLQRFQILLQPDLSAASLHDINVSEQTHDINYVVFRDYMICEDTLVSCWTYSDDWDQFGCGAYMGLMSPPFANGISHSGPAAKMLLPGIEYISIFSLCPASGRIVHLDNNNSVAVLDFFWYICHGHGIAQKLLFKRCSKSPQWFDWFFKFNEKDIEMKRTHVVNVERTMHVFEMFFPYFKFFK